MNDVGEVRHVVEPMIVLGVAVTECQHPTDPWGGTVVDKHDVGAPKMRLKNGHERWFVVESDCRRWTQDVQMRVAGQSAIAPRHR